MKAYSAMTKAELTAEYDKAKAAFEELKGLGLKLNMARGKPERGQLDLCMDILDVIKTDADCMDPIDGNDARQYGTPWGLTCCRELWAEVLGCKAENVLAAGRMVSATGKGWEIMRNIPSCVLTGQAAGTAAAMGIDSKKSVQDLDVSALQEKLASGGVKIHMADEVRHNQDLEPVPKPVKSTVPK